MCIRDRVREDEIDKDRTVFKNKIVERVLLENPSDESHPNTSIVEFDSQQTCELHIQEASRTAKKVRILTIRGEKYFVGSKSLLHHLCSSKRTNTRVLVLSPDARHLTPELATHLEHESAEEIKEKMHHALQILKFHARKNKNFEVKSYERTPNFKLLLFDDVMFISSFAGGGPKNDQHAKMYQIKREGNSLFLGLERYFDELWDCSVCAK